MTTVTRKQVSDALSAAGCMCSFSLRTVSFSDLARGEKQFVQIHEPVSLVEADAISGAVDNLPVIVQFAQINGCVVL